MEAHAHESRPPGASDQTRGLGVDDASLLRRAATEPRAFAALYRCHQPHVARYVRRRVGEQDADDLVAETFEVALRRLARARLGPLGIRGWLYGIASNVIRRSLRRGRLRIHARLDEVQEPREPAAEDRGALAEEARRALLALPPRYQTTLALFYLEELSVEEVARVMRCRPGTVKARLARGRERMRREFERRNGAEAR